MKSKDSPEAKDYSFLETFGNIDEEKDWQIVKAQMKQLRTRTLPTLWKVAAVIIALLGVGYLAMHVAGPGSETIRLAAGDEIRELQLPDGSHVVLNRGASLSYPATFKGRHRQVSMDGEAWFQVESDPGRPFLVSVDNRAQVEVLGTRFNVRKDSLNGCISVQVEEGRVAFSAKEDENSGLILAAGEAALMDHHGFILAEKVDPNELSWRTGILIFDQHSLNQVAEILEAYYGTFIEVDPVIANELEFTSTIRNEELETVLEELCLVLDLAFEMSEGRILLRLAP